MKSLFTLCLMAAIGGRSLAQGLINFNNSSAASTKISIATVLGVPATGLTTGPAGSYIFALFYSTTSSTVAGSSGPVSSPGAVFVTSDPSWTFSGAYAESSATPGRVAGNAEQVVNGVGPAQSASFVILGWSANIGSTVDDIKTYIDSPFVGPFVGESSVYSYTLGDGATVPTPSVFGGSTIPGFVLGIIIPEPASLYLLGLGGLAWLAARRKVA